MAKTRRASLVGRVAGMVVLATALGYAEACVVVYLREALAPVRRRHYPQAVREPLPLLTSRHLREAGDDTAVLLPAEVLREPAPLLVLAVAALGLRRRRGEGAGLFVLGFAAWDLLYYAFLKLLTGWPGSLRTWDVLFLIPVPWVAPVWAPMAVSLTLLPVGGALLVRPRRRARGGGVAAWSAVTAGAGLVVASFLMRASQAVGVVPERFDWPVFLAGWVLGVAGVFWLVGGRSRPRL